MQCTVASQTSRATHESNAATHCPLDMMMFDVIMPLCGLQ